MASIAFPLISDQNKHYRTSLVLQWLRLHLPTLVGEQRSHMPHSQKNQNTKQKQYCTTFNTDFKIVHIKKKIKKTKTKNQKGTHPR